MNVGLGSATLATALVTLWIVPDAAAQPARVAIKRVEISVTLPAVFQAGDLFLTGKPQLTAAGQELMAKVGRALLRETRVVRVEVHTDRRGSAKAARQLTLR